MSPFRSDYRPKPDAPLPDVRFVFALGPAGLAGLVLLWFLWAAFPPEPAIDPDIHDAFEQFAISVQPDPSASNRFPDLFEELRTYESLIPETAIDAEYALWAPVDERTPADTEAIAQFQSDTKQLESSGTSDRIADLLAHANLAYPSIAHRLISRNPSGQFDVSKNPTPLLRQYTITQVMRSRIARESGNLNSASDILLDTALVVPVLTRQPLVVEYLTGYAASLLISEELVEISQHPDASRETIQTLIKTSEQLLNLGDRRIALEGDRLFAIDTLNLMFGRHGRLVGSRVDTSSEEPADEPREELHTRLLDIGLNAVTMLAAPRDISIAVTNAHFDLIHRALGAPPADRATMVAKWQEHHDGLGIRMVGPEIVIPAFDAFLESTTRIEGSATATRIILAMAAYHLDTGDWPTALDQLVPDYLDAIPINPVTGNPFEYDHELGQPPSLERLGL